MDITYRSALEVASHEGLVRQAYKDSKGIWTWSIGVTNATGHNVERYIGKPQTLEHCLAVWVWALKRYADDVNAAFAGRKLTEEQFAGALSFHYNTGAIGRASWVKQWLAGDVAGARKSFMEWKKPPEIVARRTKERDLFFDGKWSNDGKVTEYTSLTTRQTPASPKRVDISGPLKTAFAAEVKPLPSGGEVIIPAPAPSTPRNGVIAVVVALLGLAYGVLKSLGWVP